MRSPSARWPGVSIALDDCGGKYRFDKPAARRAVDFFADVLTHSKGEHAGQPFVLEPFQRHLIVEPLFGWKHCATKLRRVRRVFLELPKKNGKTQIVAGLGLYLLFCDAEPGAEIVVAAADRENAAVLFEAAKAMVEDSPLLRERAQIFRRSIVDPTTRSSFKVIAADARHQHGPNLSAVLIDELHAQPDRELYDALTKGVAARRQPLIVLLTTAGNDLESICREEHDYAGKVISGALVDETYLPVVFAADPARDDWRDPKVWARVNPNLGTTVKREFLAAECAAAIAEPRRQNSFQRLHLNIWTNSSTVWIPLEEWDACTGPVSPDLPVAVAAGLDLSSKFDLTALVVVRKFRDARPPDVIDAQPRADDPSVPTDAPATAPRALNVDFRVEVTPFFWLPEDTLQERTQQDRVPYDVWERAGLLRVTPGAVVDYDQIVREIVDEIGPRFHLKDGEIGFDPYNATSLVLQLRDRHGYTVTEVPQTVRFLSEPAKLLEALVRSRRLTHDGHQVLRWNVSNATVREDKNENIFPFKSERRKRIDGVSALLDALSRLIIMPDRKAKRHVGAKRWTAEGWITA